MGLFGKEPVDKPCEADSFEQAALKNRVRIRHERDECEAYYDEMRKKGETPMESLNPAFWAGAIAANEEAFLIYQEELSAFGVRVVKRLGELQCPPQKAAAAGWLSILQSWQRAVEKNNPSTIVYW